MKFNFKTFAIRVSIKHFDSNLIKVTIDDLMMIDDTKMQQKKKTVIKLSKVTSSYLVILPEHFYHCPPIQPQVNQLKYKMV